LKTSNSKAVYIGLVVALVALGILGRWLPHPPNFAPIAAIAIFAGTMLPRRYAIIVPMVAIIASDLFIGLHSTIFYTWGSFAVIALFSSNYLRGRVGFVNTTATTVGASVLFFLVTNFGVWAQGKMYTLTFSGLMHSYTNGLPFFRNTLAGDLFYTSALFGLYYLGVKVVGKYKIKSTSKVLHS